MPPSLFLKSYFARDIFHEFPFVSFSKAPKTFLSPLLQESRWGTATVPSRHKDVVTTFLRRRYTTSLWCRHIVAMETSDGVAKTMSFQRLIKRRHNETLQQRRFCNVIWRFYCNYMATSERRWIATSQQRCNVWSYIKQI